MNLLNYWLYRIKRIKNKPFKEVLTFGFKRIKFVPVHLINKIKLSLEIDLNISTYNFVNTLQIDGIKNETNKDIFIFEYFKKRDYPKFFFDNTKLREEYIVNFPSELNTLISASNDYINKKFYFLGRYVKLDELNWHNNFAGNSWPVVYFGDINYFHKNVDVKLTWELNRHHHLTIIGLTYLLTKEEKYAKEVCDQMIDWTNKNPYLIGVNWTEGIEVSIRAYSWIFAYFSIIDSKNLTPKINTDILKNIYQHGRYLRSFISDKWIINNNHIIAELSGLLLIGILFPEFKESKSWIEFSTKNLEKELKNQIMNDGMLWEHSTGYHKFVTEMLLYPIILAKMNTYKIPENILAILENMIDLLNNISSNGKIPLIGDEDQGFMLKLNSAEYEDIIGISTIGSVLFRRNDWIRNKSELSFWLLGGYVPSNIKKSYGYPSFNVFKDSGICIFKSQQDYLLLVTCGQDKKYLHAAHRHVDMLSFTYEFNGEYFIVDNGTYIYNGDDEKRNMFRSIYMHNTTTIDMRNPCELTSFEMYPRPQAEIIKYGNVGNFNYVWASHNGYSPIIHNRIIVQADNGYTIYDWIEGDGRDHTFESYLHIHPDVQINKISDTIIKLEKNNKSIYIISNNELQIIDSKYSPRYGILTDSKSLKMTEKGNEYNGFTKITTNISDTNFEEISNFIKDNVTING